MADVNHGRCTGYDYQRQSRVLLVALLLIVAYMVLLPIALVALYLAATRAHVAPCVTTPVSTVLTLTVR